MAEQPLNVSKPVELIDDACDRFDAAWLHGSPPVIEDFLPSDAAEMDRDLARRLLCELIMIDIEYRWRGATGASAAEPAARRGT